MDASCRPKSPESDISHQYSGYVAKSIPLADLNCGEERCYRSSQNHPCVPSRYLAKILESLGNLGKGSGKELTAENDCRLCICHGIMYIQYNTINYQRPNPARSFGGIV